MHKTIVAWSACAAALLSLGATTASADVVVPGIGQSASSEQSASSSASSTQSGASNKAINLSILSPGASSGPVYQANNSGATSNAGNDNATSQTASQGGAGGVAGIGQQADNAQKAESTATSTQDHPSNTAINVSILSPGAHNGAIKQENNSGATSNAGNSNATSQTASQGGAGGVAGIGQQADSAQKAESTATSTQDHPSNTAINLSILSGAKDDKYSRDGKDGKQNDCCRDGKDGSDGYGDMKKHDDGGAVYQANNSGATSNAGNTNTTSQDASQYAKDGKDGPKKEDSRCDSCGHDDYPSVQGIGQLATNKQKAESTATSTQTYPSNTAVSLNILSPHASGGKVFQANNSGATSNAGNTNETTQKASQAGSGHGAVQGIGQAAYNKQKAKSDATSTQYCPVNFTAGPFAWVKQLNNSGATSNAGNENKTTQDATQAPWWQPVV